MRRAARMISAVVLAFASFAWAQSDVQRGGTMVYASNLAVESLDPHLASTRNDAWVGLLFDTLLSYRPVGDGDAFEIGPALAVSYEVIEPTVLEFALRQGVRFHDGSEWNADVAAWNLLRARDHELSAVASTLSEVVDVVVVGEYILRLQLRNPQPLLPLLLTPANNLGVFFVSQQAIESLGDDAFARQPVGSGPMKFAEWIPDDRLVLERFEGHWEVAEDGQALPYVDQFVSRLVNDQTIARVELQTGNIHAMPNPLLQDVATMSSDSNLAIHRVPLTYQGLGTVYFNPSPNSESPFSSDVRLRQAVQHATNREAIAQALGFGIAEAHYYWGWYPGVPGYDETLPRYGYDPERARELLVEAGYLDGIDLEVKVINRPTEVQPLEVLQAMWAEVGINLRIVQLDRLEWLEDAAAGNFEMLANGHTGQPDPLLRTETRSGSRYNWPNYITPEMEVLWDQVSREYDPGIRNEIFREMQTLIFEDAFHLTAYRVPLVMAARSNVQGLSTVYNMRYVWLQ